MKFRGKVLMIGFGSVARCTLPVLLRHVKIPYSNITIIDFQDKRRELAPWLAKGVRYFQERITPVNVARTLSRHVSPGGLILDLSWNINCLDMLTWCHDNQVLYVNTSVEEWDPYANIEKATAFEKSLYFKQMEIRKTTARWDKGSVTAVLDHGANPGLISHFTKQGLLDIAQKVLSNGTYAVKRRKSLEKIVRDEKFPELARALGVKTIHISERDTQVSRRPKLVDEFVGTWSIEGLREEATSPVEMGWGTHEHELPPLANLPPYGPKNQIFLSQMGMNTWVRTWVPYGEIVGMIVRHAEAFSISDHLTVWKGSHAVYRPTVHYAYMPSDGTIASLHELRCRNYELQPKCRIMSDEIADGADILGALIMGHPYKSWWTGSALTIQEARKLVPHQNATTIQVAIGVVAAVQWMLENPAKGVMVPDDLPHDYVLNVAKPYLGRFISEASDWTPFKNYQIFFRENPETYLNRQNPWCFRNFLFKH